MANSSHYLPQEILVEIFSYLPAKSVGKCRCLSKTWNTNLSNSQFINLHLTRKTQENLIIISRSGFLRVTTPYIKNSIDKSHDTFSIRLSTGIIQLGDKWTKFLGSCNGLVLLRKKYNQKTFVVNPVTRQQVQIPQPPSTLTGYENRTLYGFGYDTSCHDFKVVALSPKSNKKYIVDVYSMKTRVWKNVGYSPYEWGYAEPFMVFVNGAMHWVNRVRLDLNYRIGAFDLATESFHEILLPKDLESLNCFKRTAVIQGCLATVPCYDCNYGVDTWVMTDVDSWVRWHMPKRVSGNIIYKPVAFVGDEEILCSGEWGRRWVLYDLKRKIAKEMIGSQTQTHDYFLDSVVFEESIVSPEQGTTIIKTRKALRTV